MIELGVFRKIEYILYRLSTAIYFLFYILYILRLIPLCVGSVLINNIVYIYITLFSIFTFYFLYIIYSKQSILNDALCLSGRLHLRLIINMFGWYCMYGLYVLYCILYYLSFSLIYFCGLYITSSPSQTYI